MGGMMVIRMSNQIHEVEYLKTEQWETDEVAKERFLKNAQRPVEIVNTKRVCGKLLKVFFRETGD